MNESLKEAKSIIKSLLRYGTHSGKCTNFDDRSVPCEKHISTMRRREKRAVKFLESKDRP